VHVPYNGAMPTLVLITKLFIPPPRPNAVLRAGLIARLDQGLHRKLTLISASAGFGKTSLASAWIAGCGRPAAASGMPRATLKLLEETPRRNHHPAPAGRLADLPGLFCLTACLITYHHINHHMW
jgi:hypothetical protein